jgi:hypothetical protein
MSLNLDELFHAAGNIKALTAEAYDGVMAVNAIHRQIVDRMVTQTYSCRVATIRVDRQGCALRIEWKFREGYNKNDFFVRLVAFRMMLFPSIETLPVQTLREQVGDGDATFGFREGQSFEFRICFLDQKKPSEIVEELFDLVGFQVSIPLSEENISLLERASKAEQNPDLKVREKLEMLSKTEDAFDEMFSLGIQKINAKNLPPEDAAEQVVRLRERIDKVKQDFEL